MLCCVAVGFVIATILRAWRRLTGRGPEPTSVFAPTARRPAPGGAAALAPPQAAPEPGEARAGRRSPAAVLRFAAAGVALYIVAVPALAALGAADLGGAFALWALRSAVFAVVAATLLVASGTAPRPPGALRGRHLAGCALLGLGLAWLELGLLDMHAFGLLRIEGGGAGAEVAFHGAAVLAIALGWVLSAGPAAVRLVPQRD
jgi:hypothetical protein